MVKLDDVWESYSALQYNPEILDESTIDQECLIAFEYEYREDGCEITIDTDEFTAVCPWTGLPDFGDILIGYIPDSRLLELKSLKYYLLSYRQVGIIQEHAANRMLRDLVSTCRPLMMNLTLNYKSRGGLHTAVEVSYRSDSGS